MYASHTNGDGLTQQYRKRALLVLRARDLEQCATVGSSTGRKVRIGRPVRHSQAHALECTREHDLLDDSIGNVVRPQAIARGRKLHFFRPQHGNHFVLTSAIWPIGRSRRDRCGAELHP